MTKQRNLDIMRRHANGETFASLAEDYGISRARVHQIFHVQKRNIEQLNSEDTARRQSEAMERFEARNERI